MSAKIVSSETARHFTRWVIFIIVVQTFTLLVFNLGDNSEGVLIGISRATALFGFSLFIFVPYFLVRKELMAIRKQSIYFGLLMGFVFSFIFSIILLLYTFLDVGLKAYLGKTDLNPSLIIFGSVVGAIISVIIGTISGGIAQLVLKKDDTPG